MPFFLLFLAGTAVAGWVCAADQSDKREKEQRYYRSTIRRLEKELASKESELEDLRTRLGERNHQVRVLAHEVDRLRQELAHARQFCA